jgi:hypothetical protein
MFSTTALVAIMSNSAWAGCDVSGTQILWTNSGNGDWNSPQNWSNNHLPPTGDSVCIVNGVSTVTLDSSSPSIDNLQLALGNTLDIVGQTLTMTGTEFENAGVVNISGGDQAKIEFAGNAVLSGGGTIDLKGSLNAGFLEGVSSADSLTNKDNTIEGSGVIGGNNFIFNNEGTVDANAGHELLMANMSAIANSGLLESTNGSDLEIFTSGGALNNAGGTILADGGMVALSGEIDGGTLKTINGGVMQTEDHLSPTLLNGVTLAAGSTYLTAFSPSGAETDLEGVIVNHGTFIATSSSSWGAILEMEGSVTLEGGGTIQLHASPEFEAVLRVGSSGPATFTNLDNTIEGSGFISPGSAQNSFINDGSVIANDTGQTLGIYFGNVTNYGVFEADSGSILFDATLNNFSGGTLTGGTYNAVSGRIEIASLGLSGGEIVNNAANILLSGSGSIVDDGHSNALTVLAGNRAGANFTTASGAAFSTAAQFTNDGTVTIGSSSSFAVTHAASAFTNQNDGELQGGGTLVVNDLFNYGTVRPGDAGATGTLTVEGNFTQGANGTLEIDIAGQSQYSQLDVTGHTLLNGSTLAIQLIGTALVSGEKFDILNTDPLSDDFGAFTLGGVGCSSGAGDTWHCSNLADGLYFSEVFADGNDQLWLEVDGPLQQGVPEPDSLAVLGAALGSLAMTMLLRRKTGSA